MGESERSAGIGFDIEGRPISSLLYAVPAEELRDFPEWLELLKGMLDTFMAIDSPEAALTENTSQHSSKTK